MRTLSFVLFAAALPAQVPSHAVVLNPPGAQFFQPIRLARDGAAVHAVAVSTGGGGSPYPVHYCRSLDGGRSWPLRSTLGAVHAIGDLAIAGDRLYLTLYDPNGLGGYLRRSTDGGTTWTAPQSIAPGWLGAGPLLHADGLVVNAVWTGYATAGVHARRSTDGGVTWSPTTQLDTGIPFAFNHVDGRPLLLVQAVALHVFWLRLTPTYHIAYQRSLDGGATWLPQARVLANSPLVDAVIGQGALLVQAGTVLLRSLDQGTTWHPLPGHALTNPVDLAMDGPNVLAVERVAAVSGSVLRMTASTDAGATWSAPFVQPSTNQGGTRPSAHVLGSTLCVHERLWPGPIPGRILQSDDFGASWRTVLGDAGEDLWLWPDGGIVLSRNSASPDVLAWSFEGHTTLGAGTPGTAGLVPSLRGRGLAGLGHTFALEVDAARGGTFGGFFASFGSAAAFPLGAATLYLAQPIGPFGFTTTGAAGVGGVGTASLPVVVPTSPAFAGIRLLSQAFLLDPAAAGGFAATRALESWIR